MTQGMGADKLPKNIEPKSFEQKHYTQWEETGAFKPVARPGAEPFVIMIPPPNVTGSLHIGHALNYTLQDIFVRWHRMKGYETLWQPGMDHAGIATQMVVERQLLEKGIKRSDLSREDFIAKIWEWKDKSGGMIVNQMRRLGFSADWSRARFTMDEGLSRAVRKVFVRLYADKLIYKDKRLVNWDPGLNTAISDLEVQQVNVDGKLWHIKYPLEGKKGEYITVATTRPETMFADTGIAVHPEDERYQDIIGTYAILPVVGRRLLIVADEYANPEEGSGAVKITPGHDFNDFEVGRRHDLEIINILTSTAILNENAPQDYQGLDRYTAREKIVSELEENGFLEKIEDHQHSVPHGDRSGVAIEPWLTDQWYCAVDKIVTPSIAAVENGKTTFIPKQWENTYFTWLRNIQPWCISRQLWWGHQIPAWYGPDGTPFVAESEGEALAAARDHYGKDVDLQQDPDVLDTWFSSALWPFSTLGWPDDTPEARYELSRFYPGSLLITGFDIIFFWVARMMMMGLYVMKDVPFKDVYIHALVRDQYGAKMSKSKGNVIDPLDLSDRYGADALRFTLASQATPGRDIRLAESRVEGYRNFITKLWNAARFVLMNEAVPKGGFDPASVQLPLNKWIIGKLVETSKSVEKAVSTYRVDDVCFHLYQFTWHSFCDWYIELAKPMLSPEASAQDRAEVQATMGWVMHTLLTYLHPVIPFVTEELWEHFKGEDTSLLIVSEIPALDAKMIDTQAGSEIDWVIRLISEIRTVRAELSVPPKAQIQLKVRDASTATQDRLKNHRLLIERLGRLHEIVISLDHDAAKGSAQFVLDEATFSLPLADIIDVGAEEARLSKEKEKVAKEMHGIERKLQNPQFLQKAPSQVVEEQKSRLESAKHEEEKLQAAINRLKAL